MNINTALSYFIITLGSSFQFGYNSGVISAPLDILTNFTINVIHDRNITISNFGLTCLQGLLVGSFPFGGIFGVLSCGYFNNRFGRKGSLRVFYIPTVIGNGLMFASKYAASFEMIIIGRFIVGFAVGGMSDIAPTMLMEFSTIETRGAAGSLNPVLIVLGQTLSQVLGLPITLATPDLWHYLLSFTIITSTIQFFLLPFCPESPRYLYITKNKEEEARKALLWLRNNDTEQVDKEILEMKKEIEDKVKPVTLKELFKVRHLRVATLLSILLHVSVQMAGIAVVVKYATKLLEDVNIPSSQAMFYNIGIGVVNFIFTLISLMVVDRFGRKILHLGGLWIELISISLLTLCIFLEKTYRVFAYLCIVSIYTFVAGFAIGPGSIPWFVVAEMFVQETRDAAMSIAINFTWSCQVFVVLVFPTMNEYMKEYSLLPFIVLILTFIVVLQLYLPETKGKTPLEIQDFFKAKYPSPQEEETDESPLLNEQFTDEEDAISS